MIPMEHRYQEGPYTIVVRGDGYVAVYDRQGQMRWWGTEDEALQGRRNPA